MTKTTITLEKASPGSSDACLTVHVERKGDQALDDSTIAELSPALLSQMADDELVRVVEAARLPLLRPHVLQSLHQLDRENLMRLAHLARRCCQGRLATSRQQIATPPSLDADAASGSIPLNRCW